MNVAIIDMGTNTFNLLVARFNQEERPEIIYEEKLPVRLGEGGLNRKIITPEAWQRGLDAINTHMAKAKSLGAGKFFAFATSATRDASNGTNFVEDIRTSFGLNVEIIDGNREATLVYKGVREALDLGNTCSLILDIGGGSNEIILGNTSEPFWLHSFNLGVSRLMQQFQLSDPITQKQLRALEEFINVEVQTLFDAARRYVPVRLVGSSGSFDSIRSIMEHSGSIAPGSEPWAEIPLERYFELHNFFITSTHDQRMALKGLDPMRVDLIVPASVFINLIIQKIGINKLFQSSFALKEGFMAELQSNHAF
ncbi:MAG: hypothetical protein KBI11_02775 [Bacteroidales bacterium]|jgi:exopolyphosphatase/guanosine-5'-triphosphate,3'-diphosphate pyrophosphatase|nr:hypothetical protein [Bacteroidales bacterium]HQQ30160.1 hypothetical protein [Tenuifilaceae bacterium]